METKHKNGVAPVSSLPAKSKSLEVLEKPKRRRIEEKLRILREADACTSGTIGAVLRREGIRQFIADRKSELKAKEPAGG